MEDEWVRSQRLLDQRPEERGNILIHFQGHAVSTQPVPTGQVTWVHRGVTGREGGGGGGGGGGERRSVRI